LNDSKPNWAEESIFIDGPSFYHRVLSELGSVARTLDVEVYIFSLDQFGLQVANQLIELASNGVRVRVMVDGVGSLTQLGDLESKFKGSGVEFKVFGRVGSRGLWRFFNNLNRRNHRKVWILDQRVAYLGGLNIAQEAVTDWKDYGVRVVGEGVHALVFAFERAWLGRRVTVRNLSPKRPGVLLNDTYLKRVLNFVELLTKAQNARKRLWLASAYLAPHPALIRKLLQAARRGVDVRILISKKSDVFFMPWLASIYFEKLLRAGVKIYEYMPAFFHGKVRLIDNEATIGSSNLNYRSLLHDLEVDVELKNTQTIVDLEESLKVDFSKSSAVTLESIQRLAWYKKLLAKIFFRLRYWL
jgi:cardiolipin synthase